MVTEALQQRYNTKMTINRECGDCNACCIWLKGESYSHEFGGGKPCHFLKGNCSIYETRPEVCKTYQCAWLQGLFSENLKPEKSKVIISVENWSKGQFLRAIEMGKKMDDNVLIEIQTFCQTHKCPAIIQYDGKTFINGPDEFIKEKTT